MPIYRGTKNQTLFLGPGKADGTSNVRVYLGDKLVYAPFRPPEGDLLLAGPRVYLKAGAEVYLDYKNQPLLRQDTLSNRNIGTGAFDVSFMFTPDKTASYRELLHVPGLVKFWYSWQSGYGLVIEVPGLGARAISTEDITAKSVQVRFWKATADDNIVLQVGDTSYTLAKSWVPWTQPDGATAYGNYTDKITFDDGTILKAKSGQYNQFVRLVSMPYGADIAQYYPQRYHVDPKQQWWFQFEFPQMLRVLKCKYATSFNAGYTTEAEAIAAGPIIKGDYGISIYKDETLQRKYDGPFKLDSETKAWKNGDYWNPYNTIERVFTTPIKTDTLCMVFDTEAAQFLNYSWMYFGQISIEAEKYVSPSYRAGQLQLYSTKELSNLILA